MITAGTRLGPYEIASALSAGGIGEIYQAHDTKLARDVAIKVLPEAFAHTLASISKTLSQLHLRDRPPYSRDGWRR
jgi:serine/threonine protein kinase